MLFQSSKSKNYKKIGINYFKSLILKLDKPLINDRLKLYV